MTLKITAVTNQAALNEVRAKVESIQVHHAAHLVKNGLLGMIDAYLVNNFAKIFMSCKNYTVSLCAQNNTL